MKIDSYLSSIRNGKYTGKSTNNTLYLLFYINNAVLVVVELVVIMLASFINKFTTLYS
jgi:hypothetical protein